MTNELIERMNKAMKRIGGPLAVLNLPEEVKEIINPLLWSAEKPNLYGVLIECNGEFIYKKVGFRTIKTSPLVTS